MSFDVELAKQAMDLAQRIGNYQAYDAIKYSDDMLHADVAAGGYGHRTHPRQAAELLKLDTVARRYRAMGEAQTRQNLQGGTISGCLNGAIRDLKRMIESGAEDQSMYAEAINRRVLEQEREIRERTGVRTIVYPSEMRRA